MDKKKKEKEIKLVPNFSCPKRGFKGSESASSPTEVRKPDYGHIIGDGYDVEYIGVYKKDKFSIVNPPDRDELVQKILKLLRGSGIGKITVILLDTNL